MTLSHTFIAVFRFGNSGRIVEEPRRNDHIFARLAAQFRIFSARILDGCDVILHRGFNSHIGVQIVEPLPTHFSF